MPDAHANFASSTVATAPSPATSGTSLVVASGDGGKFPAVPFNATIWPAGSQPSTTNAEIVRVTARTTDTLTITRAQESTSARTVVVGDQIVAGITAKILTDVETYPPALLIGSQFPLIDANNSAGGFTLNTEYCFGFTLPGSGTLDSIGLDLVGSGDTGSVIRWGVRTNNAGKPTATVVAEGTVSATTGGLKQVTGLSIPYGGSGSEVLWLSLVWQGGTATSPTFERGNISPWFFQAAPAAGYGATGGGNPGWTQNTLTQTSVTGTLAAKAAAPLTLGAWGGSGGTLPHFYVRRGT